MRTNIFIALSILFSLSASIAYAATPSVAIQSLSPGASVMANNKVTFGLVAANFYPQMYTVSDSFSGSSVSSSDFDGGGNFWWVPSASDVGTHTLTVTASDNTGDRATVTQTITVLSGPTIAISGASPTGNVAPGTTYSFNVATSGFTNPYYSVSDVFGGSSAVLSSVDASGHYAWTPDLSQQGLHTITVTAGDSLGHSASASVDVRVGNPPSLLAQVTSTSTTVMPGQQVTMIVSGVGFSPSNFSLQDSNPVSTVSNSNISSSGSFSWTPGANDFGYHTITFYGVLGNYGQSATTSKTITVLGPNGQVPPAPAAPVVSVPASGSAAAPTSVSTTSTTATSTPGYTFTTFLGVGYSGPGVKALQTKLTALGLYSGPITGYFGALTRAAVKVFQAQNGLSQFGYVGPGTRAALNKL